MRWQTWTVATRWRAAGALAVAVGLVLAASGLFVLTRTDPVIRTASPASTQPVASASSSAVTSPTSAIASTTTATVESTSPPASSSVPPIASPPPPAPSVGGAVASAGRCSPVGSMTRRQMLASLVMVGVDPSDADSVADLVGAAERPGGVFIGGNPTDVFSTLPRIVSESALIVAVDDEGGRVQRIDGLVGDMPSARRQAAIGTDAIRSLAASRARDLLRFGVTMNFAPVVDVSAQSNREVIGDRSYGEDPSSVIAAAGAFASGMRDGGVIPVLKHFPGHGRAIGDSHKGAAVTPPLVELQAKDLVPFRELATASPVAVMMGHLSVPGLTERGLPTSVTPAAYALLRDELGFNGLIVTDDLGGMRAVSDLFSDAEAVVAAVVAGADLALIGTPVSVRSLTDALERAVADGRLPEPRWRSAFARVRSAQGCAG